jgi:hypothetical protein
MSIDAEFDYRSNRGRMAGNLVPLSHGVHTMNYVAHAQPAKDYMSMPRQACFMSFSLRWYYVNMLDFC